MHSKNEKLFHRRFFLPFTGLLLVAGSLLWWVAHPGSSMGIDLEINSTTFLQLTGAGLILVTTLPATVLLLRRGFTRPIHLLAEYVRSQRAGTEVLPPISLLQREDDLGLLTLEIQRLLETLRNQNEKLLE